MARTSKPPFRVKRAKHVVGRGYNHEHGELFGTRVSGGIIKPVSNDEKKDVYGSFSPFVKWFHDNVASVFDKAKPFVNDAMLGATKVVNSVPGVKDVGEGFSRQNYGRALGGLTVGVGNQLLGPLIDYYGLPFVESEFGRYMNSIRNRRIVRPVDVEVPFTYRLLGDSHPFADTGLSFDELHQLGFDGFAPLGEGLYASNGDLLREVRSSNPGTYAEPGGYVYKASELRKRVRL